MSSGTSRSRDGPGRGPGLWGGRLPERHGRERRSAEQGGRAGHWLSVWEARSHPPKRLLSVRFLWLLDKQRCCGSWLILNLSSLATPLVPPVPLNVAGRKHTTRLTWLTLAPSMPGKTRHRQRLLPGTQEALPREFPGSEGLNT
ncbi:uncharacterized protein LOC115942798 [Leptonychotes weddellii]|uniref:Uncharacterized protein LOC115942798 n=1 Tax=Leptonychotes weddellii TaxID=9713 RepID=A0A7F8RB19_LEPWE|nr:uncharacterized protein LOC115942798 [Leptonychotes weddellii]